MQMVDGSYPVQTSFNVKELEPGQFHYFWLQLVTDGLGRAVCVPIMAARGANDGPVVGLTAAVHGNEINGIPVIHKLFTEVDIAELRGTIIGVPVANVISFLRKQRRFNDGKDLNHIMPGREDGNVSEVYAHRLFSRIVRHFDYLTDLHTASFGRINSYYIRADMDDPATREMALLQNADIIVHNPPSDGTLRGAADAMGIPAITLEVGDPNKFQKGMIRSGYSGIRNLLSHLGMIDEKVQLEDSPAVMCPSSEWMYTDDGGVLRVLPEATEVVKKGDIVANLYNIFGDHIKSYYAPFDGVVIGKETNPVSQTGGRILHLGRLE